MRGGRGIRGRGGRGRGEDSRISAITTRSSADKMEDRGSIECEQEDHEKLESTQKSMANEEEQEGVLLGSDEEEEDSQIKKELTKLKQQLEALQLTLFQTDKLKTPSNSREMNPTEAETRPKLDNGDEFPALGNTENTDNVE